MIIAIDGPAGAGKSTVAKLVAKKLGCTYIDTGAMYRAFGLKLIRIGGKFTEEDIKNILKETHITIEEENIYLDGEDVSSEIRTEKVAKMASQVAKIKIVREKLVELQRQIANTKKCVVMEGRDIGSVVFPNAEIKIFLTASPEERAKRRHKELLEKGFNIPYEHLLEKIKERDKADENRKIAPLKPTDEHIIIDTTNKTIDEVVDNIVSIAKRL